MVVGESGLGKTTFINTLFSTTIKNYAEHRLRHKKQMDKTVRILRVKLLEGQSSDTRTGRDRNHQGRARGEVLQRYSANLGGLARGTGIDSDSLVRLTVIDTPGFGDYVNNRDSWMPIVEFIDDQHESYMLQEQQPRRTDKIDLRVHACLYFVRPTGHTLKPLDIEVMKRLSTRVNLIPVVAKADTLSQKDLGVFKQRVGKIPGKWWLSS